MTGKKPTTSYLAAAKDIADMNERKAGIYNQYHRGILSALVDIATR